MTKPDEQDFKDHFYRDFPFSNDNTDTTKVMDKDICKAINEASVNINSSLFLNTTEYKLAFLYLAAHYLCIDLQASSQGIAGQFSWATQSKSVGSVSEAYGIPQKVLNDPYMAMLCKTMYGAKYISLVLPKTRGAIFAIGGATLP